MEVAKNKKMFFKKHSKLYLFLYRGSEQEVFLKVGV